MNSKPSITQNPAAPSALQRYQACKAMARGYAESKKQETTRLAHGRALCAAVIETYWDRLAEKNKTSMKVKPCPERLPTLTDDVWAVARSIGELITEFPVEDAGYLIGSIYTVTLPPSLRSELGAFYTPPPLVARLLDLAEQAGFDFKKGSVIDPACGGGAFLAPVALRMIANSNASADWLVRSLGKRLRGVEIDPFAAWMTRVLLEAAVMPLCVEAQRRLADVVDVADALRPRDIGQFDLVIGNPPYGRVKLDASLRQHYARSLYGHANLYGLFTDLALRLVKRKGVIAYLTPTSFLGGQYFKSLRELVTTEATPVALNFVSDRNDVFDDVLQETLLTTYVREKKAAEVSVSVLIPQGLNAAKVEELGQISIDTTGEPWILPRSRKDADFLAKISTMPTRLSDLGYGVSTGQLVWNRHKDQLSNKKTANSLPLIWAESITASGFNFTAQRRNHSPYIEVRSDQNHLVTKKSCVILQRTTSKEQERRLLAAVLPQGFIDKTEGCVIENHLNFVQAPSEQLMKIKPETVAALLNSDAADRAFRCISGSVAVSAYELNAIPLPSVSELKKIELLVMNGASSEAINRAINVCYGEP
ncbi:HsdM family class I SAM-dependent methyltransferase [Xanthomonas oryzae pv. oryzicola]|uniref:HsdM family class I SAM-dependent methyltransferase n=1 Tax=Xanthomonas oryzae TaxID=347 RepID=UPI003D1648D0